MAARPRKRAKAGYMISAVAELYKLHPQTLRLYERVGLLTPSRSQGNTRLYTDQDLERLEVILNLTRELGVNLAGIEIILNMRDKMAEMQSQMEAFTHFVRSEMARGFNARRGSEVSHRDCADYAAAGDSRTQVIYRLRLARSCRRAESSRCETGEASLALVKAGASSRTPRNANRAREFLRLSTTRVRFYFP